MDVLLVLKSLCLIIFFRKNIRTINLLATKILFIFMLSAYVFMSCYVWLRLNEVEILNRTLDLNLIFVKVSLCDTGIFIKLSLLRNLTLSISNDDESLEVPGYIVYLEQTIQYQTKGYYRNYLPLENLGIQYLQERINLDIMIERKSWKFVSLYRLANQSQEDFE